MKDSSKEFVVYGLVDPRYDETFYVGVTKRPDERLRDHLNPRSARSKPLAERLNAIAQANTKPDMVVLSRCGRDDVHRAENYYIEVLQTEGAPLVNRVKNRDRPRFKGELTSEERQSIILAALSGVSPSKLAQEYGVSRSHVYKLKEEAKERAEEEAEFWLAVRRLAKEERK